jgi:restriction system protein
MGEKFFFFKRNEDQITLFCSSDKFQIKQFYTDHSTYGNLKRVTARIMFVETIETFEVFSTSLDTFLNKLNNKAGKIIEEWLLQNLFDEVELEKLDIQYSILIIENLLKEKVNNYKLLDKDKFKRDAYVAEEIVEPDYLELLEYPREPLMTKYLIRPTILERIFKRKFELKQKKSLDKFYIEKKKWENACKNIDQQNEQIKSKNDVLNAEYKKLLDEQEAIKAIENSKIEQFNNDLEQFFNFESKEDILTFLKIYLAKSNFDIPKEYLINTEIYFKDSLISFNLDLTSIESLPKYSDVSVVKSRLEKKYKPLPEKERKALYETLLYSISISLVYLLYRINIHNSFETIAINGFVTTRSKKTGNKSKICIQSLSADISSISEYDFEFVDPKACFKGLKGISGAKLSDMIGVKPIINLDKNDTRLIDDKGVIDHLDESVNLASMDWQEFEILVRDIFEKEFSSAGAEVKVTQSSRDKGVDAIIYDPDPIKGGKIIIQAKRYTNVVGVNNVRDLYGTIMNEGANFGIIITTSNFGSDAYEFAKDKPIKLLNGENLLHLLTKYNYSAHIDIKTARITLGLQDN